MADVTVVFADLTGSTGVFEALGDAKATQAITRLTDWMGKLCTAHSGRVVKNLGDGVLMVFGDNNCAIEAVTDMQRVHADRIKNWPEQLQMRLQVGLARGEVIEQGSDYFGDAVNVASRLSDLSGPDQILCTETVANEVRIGNAVRLRSLGNMEIRGRQEPCAVYRLEWQNEVSTEFFTLPATLNPSPFATSAPHTGSISLSWLDVEATFTSDHLPIYIGRDVEAEFVINDPRVSRLHAKISWRAGRFHLEDVSSYGTWVRFAQSHAVVDLRRQECPLLIQGEIAMGAPFEDFTVPTVKFSLTQNGAR